MNDRKSQRKSKATCQGPLRCNTREVEQDQIHGFCGEALSVDDERGQVRRTLPLAEYFCTAPRCFLWTMNWVQFVAISVRAGNKMSQNDLRKIHHAVTNSASRVDETRNSVQMSSEAAANVDQNDERNE